MSVGVSCLIDFYGVVSERFHNAKSLENIIKEAIRVGDLTNLHTASHQFENQQIDHNDQGGATVFAMLSESHLSVHTWPEYEKLVVDLFSCGSEEQTERIIAFLLKEIEHSHADIQRLNRGSRL